MFYFNKSIRLAVITIFLFSFLFVSCSKNQDSIKLVVRTGLEADGLREVAKEFTKKTGIKVNILEIGRDGYLSSVPTQLITGSADFDVAFLPSTMIAELAGAKAILPLDGLMDTKDKDLISVYGYKDKTYAIPCDISTMFLYYRSDLISDPPKTWSDYLQLAKKFSRELNPNSPTVFGCAIPGMAGEDLPKAWYCILWSYGGFIINERGEIGIGNDASIKAAQFYLDLVNSKVMAVDITSWGYSSIFENLENGKLAMAAPFWNATATELLKSKSEFKDKISYTLVPGIEQPDGSIKRISFQHAWTLAIASNSKYVSLAAKFISYATGYEGGKYYAKAAFGNPARYSILSDVNLQKERPEFKVLLESLKIANAEPSVTYYAQLHDIMNEALTQILTKSKLPESSMREANKRIENIIH